MRAFCETDHCKWGIHCGRCRNLEGGREWRQDTAKHWRVDGVDWPCPQGHPWGYAPEPVVWPKPPVSPARRRMQARRAVCLECEASACFLSRLLRTSPCEFRARAKLRGMVCPKGRWPSVEEESDAD